VPAWHVVGQKNGGMGCKNLNWIQLTQDGAQNRVVVMTMIKLQVSK
jgi:hypothetical protein